MCPTLLFYSVRLTPDGFTQQRKSASYHSMHPDGPYFVILFCLTPDGFTYVKDTQADNLVNPALSLHK